MCSERSDTSRHWTQILPCARIKSQSTSWVLRNGSMVRSVYSSCRGPRSIPQYPYGSSCPSVTPAHGDLICLASMSLHTYAHKLSQVDIHTQEERKERNIFFKSTSPKPIRISDHSPKINVIANCF